MEKSEAKNLFVQVKEKHLELRLKKGLGEANEYLVQVFSHFSNLCNFDETIDSKFSKEI